MDDLTDRDYRALARFRHALRVFLRFSEDAARDRGLTPHQHQLLLAVRGWDGPGDPAVSELAQRLQLRRHSALELARRAEEAGLVAISPDPLDHRRQLVTLSAEGADRLSGLTRLHRDELRRFRQEMGDLLDELG